MSVSAHPDNPASNQDKQKAPWLGGLFFPYSYRTPPKPLDPANNKYEYDDDLANEGGEQF